ncbi:hypothetical protein CO230_03465 [Chryseobacterium sp. 6424]|uniref:hypothetical protein n=1 Tax=Chryseobacterium sp. 6424 TaxID=2039166 RepID=UPI000EFA43F5|nr:hypothetical protein [Chryseobacterium sp. 6424]AYO57265.1 hypothetical protein CO230_03465 [Chryseobacterium sp. 6424]
MKYTVVGLFKSQEIAKQVSESLEESGIRNEDYIIYKTQQQAARKQNLWKQFLGIKSPQTNPENDKLITSVEVRSEEEFNNVKDSFEKNEVVKMYEFKDMTIDEAKDLEYIKKIVELRAKSHIYAMPAISVSNGSISQGITAEVKA